LNDFDDLDPATRRGITALAAQMAAHGTGRDTPVRAVMAQLGDRWTTLILLVLKTGEWRHADLRRMLARLSAEQAISQRVLTLKLRELERDGFVARTISDDVPPKVSYRLSPLGLSLVGEAQRLIDWVNGNAAEISAARERFANAL
jgi:DNA-binding HxlR family transcriptional regulator